MLSCAMPSSSSPAAPDARVGHGWRAIHVAVALQIVLFVTATATWIRLDTVPPLWDSAHYLQQSVVLHRALTEDGLGAFLREFSRAMGEKAPLIAALPIPLYAVFGDTHATARSVNLMWIALASSAIFGIGRKLHGPSTGALAALVLNTFPLVAGMSRQYLVEYGLMALVVLWIYVLLRWSERPAGPYARLLGALLGVGLLMKVTYPLYLAAPTAVVLWQWRTREHGVRVLARSALEVMLVAVPVAALWYAKNLASVVRYAVSGGFGALGRPYGTGSVFSLSAVTDYWLRLANFGLSVGFSCLLLAILAGWCLAKLRKRTPTFATRDTGALALLLAWWVFPFLVLTFAVNKDPRYAVPMLPAIALLIALGISELSDRRRRLAFGLVALFSISNYFLYSFDSRWNDVELRFGRLVLLAGTLDWAQPPVSENWPAEAIVNAIADDAARRGATRPRVRVLFSHPRLNAHALNYFATLRVRSPRFATVHFSTPTPLPELIEQIQADFEYLLVKSADPGPAMLNVRNREVAAALSRGDLRYEPLSALGLPDGSQAEIYGRTSSSGTARGTGANTSPEASGTRSSTTVANIPARLESDASPGSRRAQRVATPPGTSSRSEIPPARR